MFREHSQGRLCSPVRRTVRAFRSVICCPVSILDYGVWNGVEFAQVYKPLSETTSVYHQHLSSVVRRFITDASMEAVPEPVMNTTRASSSAFANSFISCSFSFIVAENSEVRKYGTCSAPISLTASADITGPTVKLAYP